MPMALPFTTIFNLRDLGGYHTTDGRTVVAGRLYRADNLGRLAVAPADLAIFQTIGIRTVVDLRRPREIAKYGRVPELPGLTYHHALLDHEEWPEIVISDLEQRVGFLLTRYGEMATSGIEAIGTTLRLIADPSTAPLVFHCMAGKDRTGIVAAIVLSLLGVDDETVAADYALTEHSVRAWHAWDGSAPPTVPSTPPAVIHGLLATLRANHGSIDNYARWLGLSAGEIASLRAHLLA